MQHSFVPTSGLVPCEPSVPLTALETESIQQFLQLLETHRNADLSTQVETDVIWLHRSISYVAANALSYGRLPKNDGDTYRMAVFTVRFIGRLDGSIDVTIHEFDHGHTWSLVFTSPIASQRVDDMDLLAKGLVYKAIGSAFVAKARHVCRERVAT